MKRAIRTPLALIAFLCAGGQISAAAPLTLNLWPGRPPGETKQLPPEADQTKDTDKLIAGRRIIKLGNVSTPQIAVYRPATSLQFYMSETAYAVCSLDAPRSKFDQTGNSVFCGAGKFNQVVVGGAAKFHCDEALGGAGNGAIFRLTSWNEL